MDNEIFSIESVAILLAVLFVAFCCGFIRSLRQHFVVKRQTLIQLQRLQRRNVIVPHIQLSSDSSSQNNISTCSGVFPGDDQLRPPPEYSAVSDVLPPSYDDAIKQAQLNNERIQNENNNNNIT